MYTVIAQPSRDIAGGAGGMTTHTSRITSRLAQISIFVEGFGLIKSEDLVVGDEDVQEISLHISYIIQSAIIFRPPKPSIAGHCQ